MSPTPTRSSLFPKLPCLFSLEAITIDDDECYELYEFDLEDFELFARLTCLSLVFCLDNYCDVSSSSKFSRSA